MSPVELLQTLGLTKYEAEAYTALLREGALTGYELGKRSAVPLPRVYDVLKRLVDRGLVLYQPGDPPRYRAAEPGLFLDQVRSTMSETLDALAHLLAGLPRDDQPDGIWIVQGRSNIVTHAAASIRAGQRSISLLVRARHADDVDELARLAQSVGVSQVSVAHEPAGVPELLALVVDDRQALIGTISPADRCLAIVSGHPALLAAVRAYTRTEPGVGAGLRVLSASSPEARGEWLTWEQEKQRRLLSAGRTVA